MVTRNFTHCPSFVPSSDSIPDGLLAFNVTLTPVGTQTEASLLEYASMSAEPLLLKVPERCTETELESLQTTVVPMSVPEAGMAVLDVMNCATTDLSRAPIGMMAAKTRA